MAYGISFMSGTDGKLGWSWMFVRPTRKYITKPSYLGADPGGVCDLSRRDSRALWYNVIGFLFCFITAANSDGGFPFHREVLDPQGERIRDMEKK